VGGGRSAGHARYGPPARRPWPRPSSSVVDGDVPEPPRRAAAQLEPYRTKRSVDPIEVVDEGRARAPAQSIPAVVEPAARSRRQPAPAARVRDGESVPAAGHPDRIGEELVGVGVAADDPIEHDPVGGIERRLRPVAERESGPAGQPRRGEPFAGPLDAGARELDTGGAGSSGAQQLQHQAATAATELQDRSIGRIAKETHERLRRRMQRRSRARPGTLDLRVEVGADARADRWPRVAVATRHIPITVGLSHAEPVLGHAQRAVIGAATMPAPRL